MPDLPTVRDFYIICHCLNYAQISQTLQVVLDFDLLVIYKILARIGWPTSKEEVMYRRRNGIEMQCAT